MQVQDEVIKGIEKRIRASRAALKTEADELALKLELKRLGGDEFTAEIRELTWQVDAQPADLDPNTKADKRKVAALNGDRSVLEACLDKTDCILTAIGGRLTEEEACGLILKRLYNLIHQELNRCLNTEKRELIQAVGNL